jgi:hypothetical protein
VRRRGGRSPGADRRHRRPLDSGYRPWADAVSRLGARDEPYRFFARLGIAAYGALIVVGAGPLGAVVSARTRLVSTLTAVFGCSAVVAGLAPKDPPRAPHTLVSHVHIAATLVGGACLLVAMTVVARHGRDAVTRHRARWFFAVAAVGVVVFPFTWGSRVYGCIEIALLTLASVWLSSLALTELRTSEDAASDRRSQATVP